MKNFAGRVLLSLATGLVFIAVCEIMFWSTYDFRTQFLPTWIAYSVLAYAFLIIVHTYRVRSFQALFLAGGIYGWLGEGLLVQTMYGKVPITSGNWLGFFAGLGLYISWTGLAWHSLLTVCGVWYLFRKAMVEHRSRNLIKYSVITGILWGSWSIWWWVDDGILIPLPEYAIYAFAASLVLTAGMWLSNRIDPRAFRPSCAERIVLILIFLAYFIWVTIQKNIASLVVLPLFLGLAFLALKRNAEIEVRDDLILTLSTRAPWWYYLILFIIPTTAFVTYTALTVLNLRIPTGPVVLVITAAAGWVLFVRALMTAARTRPNTFSVDT